MSASKPTNSSLRLLILAPSPSPSTSDSSPRPRPLPAVLNALTSSPTPPSISSFSGYTSHPPLHLLTKYYNTDIGIWCDEIPLPASPTPAQDGEPPTAVESQTSTQAAHEVISTASNSSTEGVPDTPNLTLLEWTTQMISTPAAEVRAVIGGIVLVLPVPFSGPTGPKGISTVWEQYLSIIGAVHELREKVEDEGLGRDVAAVVLVVALSSGVEGKSTTKQTAELEEIVEGLEEECLGQAGILGWEFIGWNGDSSSKDGGSEMEVHGQAQSENKNRFGEKIGMARVREVLEGVDWSVKLGADDDDDPDDTIGLADGDLDVLSDESFRGLDYDLQREMMGLKLSMLEDGGVDHDEFTNDRDGEDMSMEQMQALMNRVVSIREAGADMSKPEREKFAKKEVEKIMREIG